MGMCVKKMFSEKYISTRVDRLVGSLKYHCTFEDPIYICIMDGAVQFFADMTKHLPSGRCAYIKVSSYQDEQVPGELKIEGIMGLPRSCKEIYIFDDICDSGNTLREVVNILKPRYPDSKITTITALYRIRDDAVYTPDYYAIRTDSKAFFAGYGMDNKGYDRNLPYIYDCSNT